MTDLKDDLDRALRSVTFGGPPVERAMRDGRRLRNRRRLAVLAGTAAVVAVAAGYPALTRDAATAPPVTSRTSSPSPSPTASGGRDPVITSVLPTDVANTGVVARGTVGGTQWSVAISSGGNPGDQACFTAFVGSGSTGPAAKAAGQLSSTCAGNLQQLVGVVGQPNPVSIQASTGTGYGGTTTYASVLGAVASDVVYATLRFTDGQQLKLIPVSYQGYRFIAWLAPTSMPIASLTVHLGSARTDSGQTATAIPYNAPDGIPLFGLWLRPGQAVPPAASGIIGGGTHDGQVWSETAYEGPWGTCLSSAPEDLNCFPSARLGTTELLGGWGGNAPGAVFGSAAPGVARLRIALSNGTTAEATPIALGNERLFAFWVGKGVLPTGWTAFDAKGHMVAADRRLSSTLPG